MKTKQSQKNIPKDWSFISASKIFGFIRTYAFSRENLVNNTDNSSGIGNIHYGDIHSTYQSASIDLNKVSVPMIKDDSFAPDKRDLLKDGDIVMADASEDYEGVGVTVSLQGLGNKKVVGGLHTFVLRDMKNITNKHFRQYIFRNPEMRNSLQKVANGVSVYGISKREVSKMILPLPPLPEQNRIVAVLEVWDGGIEKLKKKIEIKKNIKKGLMQELLTGKTRLPGFSGEWELLLLGDICNIKTGKKDVNEGNPNGEYPFFTCAKKYTYSDNYSFDTEAILVAGNGEVGNCQYYKGKFEAYQRTYVLTDCKKDFQYIFAYLKYFFQNTINSQRQMGAMPYIKLGMLQSYEIRISKFIEEQKAIANILTTADKEIEVLESKLKIYQEQKRFLLNNLITGKIRTPEDLKINE